MTGFFAGIVVGALTALAAMVAVMRARILLEMCKAPYASEVLRDDRRMATLMPCALAIYEDDGGKVWVSKMNTGLMGRFFGGTVGRVMGGRVSSEEEIILGELAKPASAVSASMGAGEQPAGVAARK